MTKGLIHGLDAHLNAFDTLQLQMSFTHSICCTQFTGKHSDWKISMIQSELGWNQHLALQELTNCFSAHNYSSGCVRNGVHILHQRQ